MDTTSRIQAIVDDMQAIREQGPLVTNITNYVVTNSTANALLAIGGSPIMTHATEELEELMQISSALVINLGTVAREYLECMPMAMAAANKAGVPVVVDPVGAGATRVRTETPHKLVAEYQPAVIRGNGSEIMALAGATGTTKGVDSSHDADDALTWATSLAKNTGSTVAVSGQWDVITDGERVHRIGNGHAMMPRVTGLGCTATALMGAFCAVNADAFQAAVNTMAVMGICGEMAAELSNGPGTLQMHFYDALYNIGPEDVRERLKYE